ncbi:unnamed protein product [Protopolystoma xenopodis]|uniref:Uncharacterized protein n=1 Tax=Protopolystoma xenopodis TaxID=117903 RepID=A0A3S5BUT4_9PLAT|nr:unnamed protein product [Protopolystoma xenopodis]
MKLACRASISKREAFNAPDEIAALHEVVFRPSLPSNDLIRPEKEVVVVSSSDRMIGFLSRSGSVMEADSEAGLKRSDGVVRSAFHPPLQGLHLPHPVHQSLHLQPRQQLDVTLLPTETRPTALASALAYLDTHQSVVKVSRLAVLLYHGRLSMRPEEGQVGGSFVSYDFLLAGLADQSCGLFG